MEATFNSKRIFTKVARHTSTSGLNLVVCTKINLIRTDFMHIVHNTYEIGRHFIWELQPNMIRFPPISYRPWAKQIVCENCISIRQ